MSNEGFIYVPNISTRSESPETANYLPFNLWYCRGININVNYLPFNLRYSRGINVNYLPFILKLCWCGRLGQVPQPWLASSHWLGHRTSLASVLYKKKISGMEVKSAPDIKLRFVGFIRFVTFNFGVIVSLSWFGHIHSVILIRSSE